MKSVEQLISSNSKIVYANLLFKYGFIIFFLLWGDPDILSCIIDILKSISNYIGKGGM